jgi:acetyl esterase
MSIFEPGIEAYLQKIRDTVGIHPKPNSVEERRRNTDRTHSVWKRPAPDTIDVLNWWVGLPGREVPIRLYRRKDVVDPPVILYLHGGGFVSSSYDTHDTITWGLAEATGALVISVHYRRAPENPFPAAPDDCFGVLQWVAKQGAFLEADVSRLAVVGDSAGGCLGAALAMQARDRGGPRICFQALLYPGLDPIKNRPSHARGLDPMLTREMMDYFWDAYLPGGRETRDPIAAPIRAERLDDLPPAYIAVGEFDPLLDESKEFARLLTEAGVPTEFRIVEKSIHGFLRARFASESARAEFERLCTVLRQALETAPGK